MRRCKKRRIKGPDDFDSTEELDININIAIMETCTPSANSPKAKGPKYGCDRHQRSPGGQALSQAMKDEATAIAKKDSDDKRRCNTLDVSCAQH